MSTKAIHLQLLFRNGCFADSYFKYNTKFCPLPNGREGVGT